jgi:uncharacterized RDD family membrane protein YckC
MPVSEESPRPQTATDFPVVGANSLASALERGAARLIDVLIAAVPTLVIFIVWAMGHDPAVDTFPTWPRFVFVGVAVVYEAAFVAWRGQTLGKIIVGVRVALLVNGAKPSGSQAAMRALVPGAAISIPVLGVGFYLLVFVWAFNNAMRRGIHDLAAGTVVVRLR